MSFGKAGKESEYSNEVIISKPVDPKVAFFDNANSPMTHDTCSGWTVTRGWSNSNYNYGHDGVDYAVPGQKRCQIISIGKGKVKHTGFGYGGQGHFVVVEYVSGIHTVYMHGSGLYYVKEGQEVFNNTPLMEMGNTGNVWPKPTSQNPNAGTHLHWSLWDHYPWSQSPPRSLKPDNYVKFRVR